MRPFNFSPGPSIVPPEVIEGAIAALQGVPEMLGLSIVEVSHRLPWFEGIVAQTEQALRELLAIPDSYAVLLLQGGARQQFAQVPMSWLTPGKVAAYVDTGVWARAAYDDAVTLGDARIVASGEASGYTALPDLGAVTWPENLAYVHTTSNNTIYGTQWGVPGQAGNWPDFGEVPHVCDMSSDILARPLDISKFKMIYAGAQKNAGISGVTILIIERDFMEAGRKDIPSIWQYRVQEKNQSMYNTPPTLAIYTTLLTCRWLAERGGVAGAMARNEEKAGLLYAALDGSDGFYRGNVRASDRSRMNVTFRLPSEALEKRFLAEGEAAGLHHLKGHRKAGGIRASLYNAMPKAGVEALVAFMDEFKKKV